MNATGLALGVDIGGTKIAIGLVAPDGRIIASEVFPTEAEQGFDRAVRHICDTAKRLLRLIIRARSISPVWALAVPDPWPRSAERSTIPIP
jgi:predicted NBD/HSP70 family sugar kinase